MRRCFLALCILLAVNWGPSPAAAHSLSLVAAVSIQGTEVTMRALDTYGSHVSGGTAVAAPTVVGERATKLFPLTEGPSGSYTGRIAPPGGTYDLVIEFTIGPDLFRARVVELQAGQDRPEGLVLLQPIEPGGFKWGPILYVAAAIAVVTATAVALMRKEPDGEEIDEA